MRHQQTVAHTSALLISRTAGPRGTAGAGGKLPAAADAGAGGIAAVAVALTLRLPACRRRKRVAARFLQTQLRGDLLVFDAQGWIPLWVRRDLVQVTYYMPALACDVLMLNAAAPPETAARLGGYERIFVVSPRLDAVPHPAPGIMQLVGRSEYIRDIGWIYSFVRTADQATTTQP